ncbi:MAG: amidohydrolase family protein [Bacilli bacterium]
MIIDAHTHIGYWPSLRESKKILLRSMKNENVNYAIFSSDASETISPDHLERKDTSSISSLLIAQDALQFTKRHSNLFMLYWIKPKKELLSNEIKSFILNNSNIIKGLKIHPCLSKLKITSPKYIPYIKFAEENNLPILVHTAQDKYSDISYLKKVALLYPKVTFIAAHLQLLSNNLAGLEAITSVPNIYGDTAWVNASVVKLAIKNGLAKKIMFGTDLPIDGDRTYKEDIYQAYFTNALHFNKKAYEDIMFNNANKIYKLNISKNTKITYNANN